jgi:recombinational DNA repair protein (RecF pathway)
MPGKQSHELFALSCAIFQKISSFDHPEILAALFRVKMLLHEGLLSIDKGCSQCEGPALHLCEGESYCLKHAGCPGWTFAPEEWSHLHLLATARSFALLKETAPQKELYGKILSLFNERIHH